MEIFMASRPENGEMEVCAALISFQRYAGLDARLLLLLFVVPLSGQVLIDNSWKTLDR